MGNLIFRGQQTTGVEMMDSSNNTYQYPSKQGKYFASHYIMAGEKFKTMNEESFLFGDNTDLNYLTNKPVPFPYHPPTANEPSGAIKSMVHLRKDSLKLTKVESSEGKNVGEELYAIEFIFDADTSCAVRVFLLAREELTSGVARYKPRKPKYASEPVLFKKGSDQVYNNTNFTIRPSEFQPSELNYVPGSAEIPIVIQLTVEDSDFIGQSETTYAGMDKMSDDGYAIKFMKQKIMVDGFSFITQEIYGIENKMNNSAKDPLEEDDLNDDNTECVICMGSLRDTLILPCRHLCLCSFCAEKMRTEQSKCPICRAPFYALLQIKAMRQKREATTADSEVALDGMEEVPLIEALNGYLPDDGSIEASGQGPRRSASGRSRRSTGSRKSSRNNFRSEGRSSGRGTSGKTKAEISSLKTSASPPPPPPPVAIEERENRTPPASPNRASEEMPSEKGPVSPTAPSLSYLPRNDWPITPEKKVDIVQSSAERDLEMNDSSPKKNSDSMSHSPDKDTQNYLSTIVTDDTVLDSLETEVSKVDPHVDMSLPGTPMGSENSGQSLAASINSAVSFNPGGLQIATRAQITTPSNVKVEEVTTPEGRKDSMA